MNTYRITFVALGVVFCAGLAPGQQLPQPPLSAYSQLRAIAAGVASPTFTTFAEVRSASSVMKLSPLPIPETAECQPQLSSDSTKLFSTKVQLILSNVCSSCHARANYEGGFKLKPIADGYFSPQITEYNMLIALKYVNRDKPANSQLLHKAVTAHGRSPEPPLFSRQHPAYKHLEQWVTLVSRPECYPLQTSSVSSDAKLPPQPMSPLNALQVQPSKIQLVHSAGLNHGEISRVTEVPHSPVGFTTPTTEFNKKNPVMQPHTLSTEDPYDPTEFNRLLAFPKR